MGWPPPRTDRPPARSASPAARPRAGFADSDGWLRLPMAEGALFRGGDPVRPPINPLLDLGRRPWFAYPRNLPQRGLGFSSDSPARDAECSLPHYGHCFPAPPPDAVAARCIAPPRHESGPAGFPTPGPAAGGHHGSAAAFRWPPRGSSRGSPSPARPTTVRRSTSCSTSPRRPPSSASRSASTATRARSISRARRTARTASRTTAVSGQRRTCRSSRWLLLDRTTAWCR